MFIVHDNDALNEAVATLGWGGVQAPGTGYDYVMAADANLGSKSNRSILRQLIDVGTDITGGIDLTRLTVKGGSIAVGHPFAATGARIIATLAKLLNEQGTGRGLISVCTAGGMGVSAILEAAPTVE